MQEGQGEQERKEGRGSSNRSAGVERQSDGRWRGEGCVSCYRIMTQGSHYHGSGFLSLRCARLCKAGYWSGTEGRWGWERRDVFGQMIVTGMKGESGS